MYKILIKYKSKFGASFWESCSFDVDGTITEFETDDLVVLKERVVELTKTLGTENFMVVKKIDVVYDVEINDDENSENVDGGVDEPNGEDTP